MANNGTSLDGNALNAIENRAQATKITWRELYVCKNITQATKLANRMTSQIENYWDIADLIGITDTRELLADKHTFDHKPLKRTIERVTETVVVRWKGRRMRALAENAMDEAIETLIDCADAAGIEVNKGMAKYYLHCCNKCQSERPGPSDR